MTQPHTQPPQSQSRQPGHQSLMHPQPQTIREDYRGADKLKGRVALIAGGDSGIGRAVAVHFAREGADVVIAYLDEDDDAEQTRQLIAQEGRECLAVRADLSQQTECRRVVRQAVESHGHIDVLVLSIAQQYPVAMPEDLSPEQLDRTFRTNVFSYIYLTQAALPHLPRGGAIIYTGSVTGQRGNVSLIDYSASKGAVHTLTFSMAQALAERGIRVNLVAPGPIWTPLIPASFDEDKVEKFGTETLMKRAGQPSEVGPAYVFLASEDASYITGQIVHINGGGFIGD